MLLATFSDLVPFLCDGGLALTLAGVLALLAEDYSNDSKVLGEQYPQLASYPRRYGRSSV